jgi:hypothetical protein
LRKLQEILPADWTMPSGLDRHCVEEKFAEFVVGERFE